MSNYGKMVLWMGLILMAFQIVAEWPFIRGQIFSSSSGSSGGGINLNPLNPNSPLNPSGPNFPLAPLNPFRLLKVPKSQQRAPVQ